MEIKVLLIMGEYDARLLQLVRETIPLRGQVDFREGGQIDQASEVGYDIIILDSGATKDFVRAIQVLQQQSPKAVIVVQSASPTWLEGRAAFRGGAIDYVPTPTSVTELRNLFQDLMSWLPLGSESMRH